MPFLLPFPFCLFPLEDQSSNGTRVVIAFEIAISLYKDRNDRLWNFPEHPAVISHVGRRVRDSSI
jgi:hypothetical protein